MARTSKSRGAVPFKMRSGNASPYKFLGKALRSIGGAVSKGARSVFGGGGGGVATGVPGVGMAGGMMRAGGGPMSGGPDPLGLGKGRGPGQPGYMGMMAKVGMPFMKKEKGYSPYTKPKSKSPFKTDAILVKGAGKAASANDTAKYAIIAKSRAFSDMVDSVEKTVNRSAAAQLKKDSDRAKKTVRSHDKYGDWKERYDRREHERDRHKQKRRNLRNRWRKEVWGKPGTLDAEYGSYDPTHDHGGTNTQGLYPYNYD
tara:strand:- start:7237 stop:8007 length:771 start_codon:yes stop_codon:yes gene_type:complete